MVNMPAACQWTSADRLQRAVGAPRPRRQWTQSEAPSHSPFRPSCDRSCRPEPKHLPGPTSSQPSRLMPIINEAAAIAAKSTRTWIVMSMYTYRVAVRERNLRRLCTLSCVRLGHLLGEGRELREQLRQVDIVIHHRGSHRSWSSSRKVTRRRRFPFASPGLEQSAR